MNTTTTTTALITHAAAKGMPISEGSFILITLMFVMGLIVGYIIITTLRKKNKSKPKQGIQSKVPPKDKTSRSNESDPEWVKNFNKKLDDMQRQLNPDMPPPQPAPAELLPEEAKPVESWSKEGVVNAEIVNPVARTIGFYHVDLVPNKDYGRSWLIGGKNIYSLRINNKNELEKMLHNATMEHPTSEVYEAIQTKDDIKEVFGNHDEGDNKLKIGMLVLAACVALFLMFMAVYKGGK
jgi:hypothetical protein